MLSHSANTRLQDLLEHLQKDLELLRNLEDALRYCDDPKGKIRYSREIDELKRTMAQRQDELAQLREADDLQARPAAPDWVAILDGVDSKLSELLSGQNALRDECGRLRYTLTERFEEDLRIVVNQVLSHLDELTLQKVERVLDAQESGWVPEHQLRGTLQAISDAINQLSQSSKSLQSVSAVFESPKVDMRQKLKLTVPLIPLLLSYEGELGLTAGLNLKTLWKRLLVRSQPKDEPNRRTNT